MATNQSTNLGAFIETNFIWDVQNIQETDVNSPEFKELLVRLYQNLGKMATILNVKDSGIYDVEEFVNGQLWFANPANNSSTVAVADLRQDMRLVINYAEALPNAGVVDIPHGLSVTAKTTFTRIYAVANDVTNLEYIPIPYASASGTSNIEISVDDENVYITTASNRSTFTITYIVLEYLQS